MNILRLGICPSRPFARFRRNSARIARTADGNVAIIFALTLPLVVGGAGLGVETSYWYYKYQELQAAADAAAYAGAIEKRAGSPLTKVKTVATASAGDNAFDASIGTIVINSPPTTGAFIGASAVEVILTQPVGRFFTAIFSNDEVPEQARAVASFQATGEACLLALNPSASKAVLFAGNTNLTLTGCNVMANSIADDAIKSQGSAIANVKCFISGGGVALTSGTSEVDQTCPIINAPPVGDPFAGLAVPSSTGLPSTNSSNYAAGTYVYTSGLGLKNTINLQPGTYIISGGDLSINANAFITGSGVTFYLVGGARVSINGTATLNLSAPTSGTYKGVLFFGDRNSVGGTINKFNGTASSLLTGDIYFKSQAVDYSGNFSGIDGCTAIIADTISWSGNSTINQDCSAHGMQQINTSQLIRLVE